MTTLKIALDWTPNINHIGILVAKELGLYKENGIELEIINPLERVGELKKAGSRVTFVSTKKQRHDHSVATTDRLPVGCNFAFF